MTVAIFKVLNRVIASEEVSESIAKFVRSVVQYECTENPRQFRKREEEMLRRALRDEEV